MSDKDVEREIEANEERKVDRDDDDSIVDTVEKGIDPITRLIGRNVDDEDPDEVEEQRILNDQDQRDE